MELEKFWSRVERGPSCWLWVAGKNGAGYGVFYSDRKPVLAHRYSLALHLRRKLTTGLFVLHSCDTPACVNPAHLRLGTSADNRRDAQDRGRASPPPKIVGPRNPKHVIRGAQIGTSKMTDAKVVRLLQDRMTGLSFLVLAKKYKLDASTVGDICNGERWKHIHGTEGAPTLEQLRAVPINRAAGAKITQAVAREIKQRLKSGETGRSIANRFCIHFASVSDIKRGLTWRDA